MEKPVFLGNFRAYTTKEAIAHIENKDLNLIVLHIQRQPVVLVSTTQEALEDTIVGILIQAGNK